MEQRVDPKVIDRIHKMLNLAKDGGATEAEAASAMEKAQKLMNEHNLSMAHLEAKGGTSEDGKRMRDGFDNKAMYQWQRDLMQMVGHVNYCYVRAKRGRLRSDKFVWVGYEIIGREANVVATREMFGYLLSSISRIFMEHVNGDRTQNMSKYANSFKEGCADRLRERLKVRYDQEIVAQKREAREADARNRHPASAGSGALVIYLEDVAQREADLNRDLLMGQEPGTTARTRAEREAKWNAMEAEEAARRERGEVSTVTVDSTPAKPLTEAQRRKEAEKREREQERSRRYWERRDRQEALRLDGAGYMAGQRAADKIGLDKQVDQAKPSDHKRLK